MNRILAQGLISLVAFSLLLFIGMYRAESGDMGTTMLGVVLYWPYVLLLVGYNELLKLFMNWVNIKGLLLVLLPVVPILAWLALSKGSIVVRYWNLGMVEVLLILLLLCGLNTVFFIRASASRRQEEAERS
jgi:hypothetical protein